MCDGRIEVDPQKIEIEIGPGSKRKLGGSRGMDQAHARRSSPSSMGIVRRLGEEQSTNWTPYAVAIIHGLLDSRW